MMTPQVDVFIAGLRWLSWSSLSLQISVEALCRTATLIMVGPIDRIKIGQTAKIRINGDAVLTGYVDSVSVSCAADTYEASVVVSSATQDLVDCHVPENRTWKDVKLLTILEALAQPYGIIAESEVSDVAIASCKAQQGDGIADVIERAARTAGVVVTDTGEGGLLVTRPGFRFSGQSLSVGDGIVVAVETTANGRVVFDAYDCRGSVSLAAAPDAEGLLTSRGTASGFGGRGRYLSVRAEQGMGPDDCARRAAWEAATRAGQAVSAAVEVSSWFDSAGNLWGVGDTVRARFPGCGLDADMVIQSADYRLNGTDYGASLELVPPSMYAAEPQIEKKPAKATTGSGFWAGAEKYAATQKGTP